MRGRILLSLLLVSQSGCISLSGIKNAARDAMQRCRVESIPPGAVVHLNGVRVGETPCDVGRPFGDGGRSRFEFAVSCTGYRTQVKDFPQFPSFVTVELEPLPRATALPECSLSSLPVRAAPVSVVVLDFQVAGDVDRNAGQTLADYCRETIQASGRVILVDRGYMRAILSEEDFAATFECDDTKCLVDFGRKLHAQMLVHGRTTMLGQTRVLTLKMIDVSSAAVVALLNVKTGGALEDLLDLTPTATCQLLHDALQEKRSPTTAPAAGPA